MNPSPPTIIDRRLYRLRRGRAGPAFAAHDFLHRRALADVVDRLETVTRPFPDALFYGAGDVRPHLTPRCGVGRVVLADLSPARTDGLCFDEEASPFAPGSFDLIVSLLTLHATNDPVAALAQARTALKPDGLFIGVLFGEETLRELKAALFAAEAELAGGAGPRVAPFGAVRDLGGLLQRAGFALPVVDVDNVDVTYKNPMRLFADLRGMGETGALKDRPRGLRRDVAAAALARLGSPATIRFDLVTLTGWAPHEKQQKPLRPGSASHSLAEALKRA